MENKFKQEKAVVSVERHNCLKHPPAVPLRWCQKRTVGAVLVKMTSFCRLFGVWVVLFTKMCFITYIPFREKAAPF